MIVALPLCAMYANPQNRVDCRRQPIAQPPHSVAAARRSAEQPN
jgi:hypothetical protein